LNMTRANQSDMNKGWIAIPLQFKQVIAKYYEKVMPNEMAPAFLQGTDELKGWEKFRLAAVPAGLYGVSEVPGGNYMAEQIYKALGIDGEDITPEQGAMVNSGLLGMALNNMDLSVNASSRMALGMDIPETIADIYSRGHNMMELLGPSANVFKIYGNNAKTLWETFNLTRMDEEIVPSVDDFQLMSSVLFNTMADIPKIGRNAKRYWAYFMTDNKAMYDEGQYLYDATDLNTRTAITAMLGLQLDQEVQLYKWQKEIRDEMGQTGGMSPFLDDQAEILLRIANTHILGARTDEQARVGKLITQAILYSVPVGERFGMFDRMNELANKRKLDPSNLYRKAMEQTMYDVNENIINFNQEFLKQRDLRR